MKSIIIAVITFVLFAVFNLYKKKKKVFGSVDFLEVGKLLYTKHPDDYGEYINHFRSDRKGFIEEYEDLIDEYDFEKITEFDAFRLFGDDKEYFSYIDWKGEENDREAESFIEKKLESVKIEWKLTDKLREQNTNQRDGTFIIKLFKAADADLRESGYALLFPVIDADGYSFKAVSLDTFEKVKSFAPRYFKGAAE